MDDLLRHRLRSGQSTSQEQFVVRRVGERVERRCVEGEGRGEAVNMRPGEWGGGVGRRLERARCVNVCDLADLYFCVSQHVSVYRDGATTRSAAHVCTLSTRSVRWEA